LISRKAAKLKKFFKFKCNYSLRPCRKQFVIVLLEISIKVLLTEVTPDDKNVPLYGSAFRIPFRTESKKRDIPQV